MNGLDIWINPLANPDGCYHGGNSSVSGATRYNANSVDLNRNFADPDDGPHPDGNSYQPETNIFMAFADTMHFTMSANFHGGAELMVSYIRRPTGFYELFHAMQGSNH